MTLELAAPLWTKNGLAVSRGDIPKVSAGDLRRLCVDLCSKGVRLAALFAMPVESQQPEKGEEILVVLADDAKGRVGLLRAQVPGTRRYPALSTELPQAQAF